MNKEKLTEEEKNKIINEIKNNQISNNGDIKEMYNDYYRKTSLIIILEYNSMWLFRNSNIILAKLIKRCSSIFLINQNIFI